MANRISLKPSETHIWWLRLDQLFDIPAYQLLLAKDEQLKAERFYFVKDRLSYMLSRGTLRYLLANYLALAPEIIQFEYNQYGKPAVSAQQNVIDLQFNISHSNHLACFAFTLHNAIGIDIEYHGDKEIYLDIVKRYFAKAELAQFINCSPNKQKLLFYKLWTCKEAIIKAVGKGLFLGLDKFSVDLSSLHITSEEEEFTRLNCLTPVLPQIENYSMALAGYNVGTELRIFQWQGLIK